MWRRPDGTLPTIGNTSTRAEPARGLSERGASSSLVVLPVRRPDAAAKILPISGYATFWTGLERWPHADGLAQTSVSWSNFRGHGHKHADEMSLVIWAAGREWLASVGYWPYEEPAYKQAVSWGGSNAPHVVDERAETARDTRALAWLSGADTFFLDLERRSEDGGMMRREIVGTAEGRWIVLDVSQVPGTHATRRIWNAGPGLRWRGDGGVYIAGDDTRLSLAVAGNPPISATVQEASRNPFAGWLAVDGRVVAGSAVTVDQRGSGWVVTSLSLGPRDAASLPIVRAEVRSPEHWLVDTGHFQVSRDGGRLRLGDAPAAALTPLPDPSAERLRVAAAYDRALAAYPPSRDLLYYRERATLAVAAATVVQEGAFAWIRRKSRRVAGALRLSSIVAWLAFGAWLGLAYLA
jgi:hypothetical protein